MEIQQLDQERVEKIKEGFKVLRVVIRDQDNREIYWDSQNIFKDGNIEPSQLIEAHLPERMLKSKAITRQVTFSSVEKMSNFNLVQRAYIGENLVEQFNYKFGFVIPNSTNNWDQTIITAAPKEMVPIDILNGNLVISIIFYEKQTVVFEVKLKIFYD